jgi:hypothetical protein
MYAWAGFMDVLLGFFCGVIPLFCATEKGSVVVNGQSVCKLEAVMC